MQQVQQLRIDDGDLAGAVVAQDAVDFRQRFRHVVALDPVGQVGLFPGVQVEEAEPALGFGQPLAGECGARQGGGQHAQFEEFASADHVLHGFPFKS